MQLCSKPNARLKLSRKWARARVCDIQARAATPGVPPHPATITFKIKKHLPYGVHFAITGGAKELGNWSPKDALKLVWSEGHIWTAEAQLPAGGKVEYKYVTRSKTNEIVDWQPGDNMSMNIPLEAANCDVSDSWDGRSSLVVTSQYHPPSVPVFTSEPRQADPLEALAAAAFSTPEEEEEQQQQEYDASDSYWGQAAALPATDETDAQFAYQYDTTQEEAAFQTEEPDQAVAAEEDEYEYEDEAGAPPPAGASAAGQPGDPAPSPHQWLVPEAAPRTWPRTRRRKLARDMGMNPEVLNGGAIGEDLVRDPFWGKLDLPPPSPETAAELLRDAPKPGELAAEAGPDTWREQLPESASSNGNGNSGNGRSPTASLGSLSSFDQAFSSEAIGGERQMGNVSAWRRGNGSSSRDDGGFSNGAGDDGGTVHDAVWTGEGSVVFEADGKVHTPVSADVTESPFVVRAPRMRRVLLDAKGHARSRLGELTIIELRHELTRKGLACHGTHMELVQRLLETGMEW